MPHLFCFGLGYSARVLALRLRQQGWTVSGTCRTPEQADRLREEDLHPVLFDGTSAIPETALDGVTHVLSSIPPDASGDPVLRHHAALLSHLLADGTLRWAGYLSTTGVYGDHQGGWVDEETPLHPDVPRSDRRAQAEAGWLALGGPIHLFRLSGIYGPGRSAIDSVRGGRARRIVKPGQVFSRIHVEDIATVLQASMQAPHPGRIYNVCDDEPAPPQDVIAHACTLLGLPVLPDIPFADAALSPMAASFYADNRRVSNRRIREELGVTLAYPTYRDGLAALLKQV